MNTILLFLCLAILFSIGSGKSSHSSDIVALKRRPDFQFKTHMLPNAQIIKDFTAVSSHGRDDGLPETPISTFALISRLIYLLIIFLPAISTSGLAYISSYFRDHLWYSMLTSSLAHGGAAFIKWGQWSSTRPDMFPERLCVILSNLHSNSPEHSFEYTRSAILKEFGSPIEDIFEYFNRLPLASGSIAQVYEAVLNGRRVAVKVRHPNVAEQIRLDFIIMKAFASFIESIPGFDWLHLSDSLQQFSHTIAAQTKLDIEGKHLYLFNYNFRKWKDVGFPEPIVMGESVLIQSFAEGISVSEYTELYNSVRTKTESSILSKMMNYFGGSATSTTTTTADSTTSTQTMSTESTSHSKSPSQNIQNDIRGDTTNNKNDNNNNNNNNKANNNINNDDINNNKHISSTAKSASASYKKRVDPTLAHFIVSRGEDIYLKMLLADLHPGNILIQHQTAQGDFIPPNLYYSSDYSSQDNKDDSMRIVLVDAGMVARLLDSEKENFIGFLESLGEGNGSEAADFILNFSPTVYSSIVKNSFRNDMITLFAKVCRGYGTNTDLGDVLRGILNLVRIHKVTISVNYATLIMNALCLDSLGKSLLPEYNILDGAKPLLEFHRLCKRTVGLGVFQATISVARVLKKFSDRNFRKKWMKDLE
eukprot:gene3141-6180_t